MVRIDPAGVFLPALVGLVTGLGILWTFDAGPVGCTAVGAVGFALSAFLAARAADARVPWPGLLLGGLASGLTAAVPVALLVYLWTNVCLLHCPPPDAGPALRWGGAVLAGAILVHAAAGWFVPRRTGPASSPLPDLPE